MYNVYLQNCTNLHISTKINYNYNKEIWLFESTEKALGTTTTS